MVSSKKLNLETISPAFFPDVRKKVHIILPLARDTSSW